MSLRTSNTLFELWFEWACDHCEKIIRRDRPGLPNGWAWHLERDLLAMIKGSEPIIQHACETCAEDLKEWLSIKGGDNASRAH